MAKVNLVVPKIKDLKYRQMWLMDKKTMDYNAGYDLDIKGYDKKTGTIRKTDDEIKEWFYKWIDKEPDRYYAYIYSYEEDEPIGEVYYYLDGNVHSMGIIIASKYRGKGYSCLALKELEKIAFKKNNISELSDIIPVDRTHAISVFKKAGFIETGKEKVDMVNNQEIVAKELLITKEMYENNIKGEL